MQAVRVGGRREERKMCVGVCVVGVAVLCVVGWWWFMVVVWVGYRLSGLLWRPARKLESGKGGGRASKQRDKEGKGG